MQHTGFRVGAFAALLLGALVFTAPALADFKLPEPPTYKPIGDDALTGLSHYKSKWLREKIDAEKSWISALERRKKIPEVDPAPIDKEIGQYTDAIKQDESDLKDLAGKDAFDATNPKAKANAKLVKSNVEKWIETLNGEAQHGDTPEEKKAAADNHAKLVDALKDAEKAHPTLFN